MNTVFNLLTELNNELGYNPYKGFISRNGYIDFSDITTESIGELSKSTVYYALKAVVSQPVEHFFDFVRFGLFEDMYIVGLMVELYRRVGTSPVTVYFSEEQYIEADNPTDLMIAIDQIRNIPNFEFLTNYKGIKYGTVQPYATMTDTHLLGAFFQRYYDESVCLPYAPVNIVTDAVRKVSPQFDGIVCFLLTVK